MINQPISSSKILRDVRYEIRGSIANHALELEKQGYEIISLNIGNPGLFGFRTPESMRLAMIENLDQAEPYCDRKGIFPAREAIVMQQQSRGISGITVEEVFIGNGVSELIDMSLRALLNPGDEILIPSPDYPLWSAATVLNGGKSIFYECSAANNFLPNLEQIESKISSKTKAIVVINPNNPSGAVYDRNTLEAIADLAERNNLVLLSDEIYDQMIYDDAEFIPMASIAKNCVCLTFSGLSKIYRACGYRVGWAVFSGDVDRASQYQLGMTKLSALRLCSNVPGQWAVQTALGGIQSIKSLVKPEGRLYQSRNTVINRAKESSYLHLERPMGAMYAFLKLDERFNEKLDDYKFAHELLEKHHVLIAPGSSFNTPYNNHFRITTLPDSDTIDIVFDRIEDCLKQYS